jgi:arabinogalactan endo-1,4-beta-galactosidase
VPLAETLRNYVQDTLIAFRQAGVDLTIVALGNEIRDGMLWPIGRVDVDIEPMSALWQTSRILQHSISPRERAWMMLLMLGLRCLKSSSTSTIAGISLCGNGGLALSLQMM